MSTRLVPRQGNRIDVSSNIYQAWISNPDWKNTFWGSNYPRLSEIKQKWDPEMVFYVTPGINADHMVAKEGRLCKVQGAAPKMERDMAPLGDNRNDVIYQGDKSSFPILFKGKGVPPSVSPLPGGARPAEGTTPKPDPKKQIPRSSM
jgi:hypothetical protein